MNQTTHNILLTGVGGQGLITLLMLLSEAARIENKEIRTSELHGLSQREGSVQTHFRMGEKVHSPIIPSGEANLVLSLEAQEALAGLPYTNQNTRFIINKYKSPTMNKVWKEEEIKTEIKKISSNLEMVPAYQICREKLESSIVGGVFLLGKALESNIIPLKINSVKKAIKKILPEKHQKLNLKALELKEESSK